MDCPTCSRELRRLPSATIHSWICDGCKSVASEIGSLGETVSEARMAALSAALKAGATGTRACPKCEQAMRQARIEGGLGAFEVDGCVTCRIAWFDRGELRNLQALAALTPPKLSSMTPEQRHAWRIEHLREAGRADDDEAVAVVVSLMLGIPYPDPVRDYRGRPWATIAICVVVTVTSLAAFAGNFDEIVRRFGMIPDEVVRGRWLGLVTHFFLHVDLFHLGGNLLFLFFFGSRVEALIGVVRYLSLIAVATIAGGLVHTAFAPDSSIPLIGASGGISGVLAAHACLRPRAKVRMRILYTLHAFPATTAFLIWIALQLIGTAMQIAGASAVSALGHLGGAVAGYLCALIWRGRARTIEPVPAS